MAYTTIKKPSDYFNTKLYTGNGSTNAVTGVGFQPDWVWIKDRTVGFDHVLQDSVRGTTKIINSNQNYAEFTNADSITSFNSDGFTTGSYVATNQNTTPYVAWNWLADNTSGSSNTDGSITSTVSANTTSGFSIVGFTGTGANATVGHGLGKEVDMIFFKNRSSAQNWSVYARPNGAGYGQFLNSASAKDLDNSYFNSTDPTSSVFSVGTNSFTNGSGNDMIAYCFASVKGFSKIGSYTGNGGAGGQYPFIYTGFKPAMVILKRTDSAENWDMLDNKRNTYNVSDKLLKPNSSNAEATFSTLDMLSNGFKIRNSDTEFNASGGTYIYMAFAEEPLVGDNPATAR